METHKINCQYWRRVRDRGQGTCLLSWYGGNPWLGNCLDCIKRGDNTPEAKTAFDARADKTHPANRNLIGGCCGKKSYPSLTTMGGNFISALAKEAGALVSGEEAISEEMIKQRIATCQSCEHFVQDSKRCVKCGCFIKIKARMRSQSCPIGKW